jgi:hypothetical protein
VEYGIKAHNATLTSDIVSATITVPTPRPPFGAPEVQATLQSDGSVQITWGEVEDATSYSVWYKEASGSWTKLTNNGTDGSYTVTNPPTGNVQFTVKAHNGTVVSGISPVALYIPGATPLPEFGAPEVQAQLQQDDGAVVITWGEVQDANRYSVWYKETGGSWTQLSNNVSGGTYTVTNPPTGEVQFTVKAHNGTVASGINTVTLNIPVSSSSSTLPPFGAPNAQAELQEDGSVLITWGEVEDATNYSVWYKETGGAWVKLTNNGTNGSYIITNPPIGVVQFAVKAHNGTTVSSIIPVILTIV